MPREGDVRLTQDGYEDIDDFFKSPPPSFRPTANANAHARAASSKKSASKRHATAAAAAPAPLEAPGSASRRQRAGYRPDVTHEIGVRGRCADLLTSLDRAGHARRWREEAGRELTSTLAQQQKDWSRDCAHEHGWEHQTR